MVGDISINFLIDTNLHLSQRVANTKIRDKRHAKNKNSTTLLQALGHKDATMVQVFYTQPPSLTKSVGHTSFWL